MPPLAKALDFGAGSLRETYALAADGFAVTAVDMCLDTMQSYYKDYDWTSAREPQLVANPAISLVGFVAAEKKFDLICAFDVLEHLDRPEELCEEMRDCLDTKGVLFCSVPNRLSLVEILTRARWKIGLARGRVFAPGEPHVQFRSPNEWRRFFNRSGFEVVDHEMAMGVLFVTWTALAALPARWLDVFMQRRLGWRPRAERAVTTPTLMSKINAIDGLLPRFFERFSGSNLFVLRAAA